MDAGSDLVKSDGDNGRAALVLALVVRLMLRSPVDEVLAGGAFSSVSIFVMQQFDRLHSGAGA